MSDSAQTSALVIDCRMASDFLGDVRVTRMPTSILSMNELLAREGINLQKSMNFREDPLLSVFLVLPREGGAYTDSWDPNSGIYTFEGHDSTTIDAGGKSPDQLLMYADGRITENGKFYKAANEYVDRVRKLPLEIQIYEKLDPGVWFDKGIFELVGVVREKMDERSIFKFKLQPSQVDAAYFDTTLLKERMLPASIKAALWSKRSGRCAECGSEKSLRFVAKEKDTGEELRLICALHRGEGGGLLG